MLDRIDHELPITTFAELQQVLIQCARAKNCLSIRKGYSPEIPVFGKSSKVPGSLASSEEMTAHASANNEDAQGIEFRQSLALREKAQLAFHQADNDMALRRACLRRSRPDRAGYQMGEWVMMWQPQNNGPGYWFGTLKVIQQENNFSVWATMGGKLHRRAPEHIRPVSSAEARQVPEDGSETANVAPRLNEPEGMLPHGSNNESGESVAIPNQNESFQNPPSEEAPRQSQEQPDGEPEDGNSNDGPVPENGCNDYINTPIPNLDVDDDLVTSHLLRGDDDTVMLTVSPTETPCAWPFEVTVPSHWKNQNSENESAYSILLASTEKKQRTEVKLSTLSAEEQEAFKTAKQTEVNNWLSTGTVSKVLRDKLAPEQFLRCRWLLVWKDREEVKGMPKESNPSQSKLRTHKPKARLVVLGYLDPNLTEVPRDSPTLGRISNMLAADDCLNGMEPWIIRHQSCLLTRPNS